MEISKNGSTIQISKVEDHMDEQFMEKAIHHWEYLRGYRKSYSKKRKAKLIAVRAALKGKGVDVVALEKEALKNMES